MKKTAVFLAEGFEETEAITPIDMLRRAGVEVTLVSITGSKTVTGSHGIPVTADVLFNEPDYDSFDMLLLPGGGPGTKNLESFEELLTLLKKADGNGKILSAICAAPRILGKLGFLKGQRAVCYPGNEEFLEGAEVPSDEKAVISGRYVTAKGMGAAVEFGAALIEVLLGKEKAEEILDKICF